MVSVPKLVGRCHEIQQQQFPLAPTYTITVGRSAYTSSIIFSLSAPDTLCKKKAKHLCYLHSFSDSFLCFSFYKLIVMNVFLLEIT